MKCLACQQKIIDASIKNTAEGFFIVCGRCGYKNKPPKNKLTEVYIGSFSYESEKLNTLIKHINEILQKVPPEYRQHIYIDHDHDYYDGDVSDRRMVFRYVRPYTDDEIAKMETEAYKEQQRRQEKLDLYNRLKLELGL